MDEQQTRESDAIVDAVVRTLARDSLTELAARLPGLPTQQLVHVLERLGVRQRAAVYRLLPEERALDVFRALPPTLQSDLVDSLQDDEVAALFVALEPDDRVWLLDELPAPVAERLLGALPDQDRRLTSVGLEYPRDSIGRRMSAAYVATHPEVTVVETLRRLRARVDDAETLSTIPVVDHEWRLVGVVGLRDLLRAPDADAVSSVMRAADASAATDLAEDAARRCADLRASAVPIVDADRRLVGILTLGDAVRILEQEESEDAARQGGAEPLRRPYLSTSIASLVRSRVVWLLVLAVGATLTVQVLEVFEATLEQVTVLALFVPLLIGTGGNTGNQAATTVTRALALGDVRPRDLLRVLSRELRVGLLLGVLLGAAGLAIAGVVYGFQVGAVIGLTLLAVCTVAAVIGGIMPLIARALRVDPAVFSNPFITTFVDATGLVIYFLVARAVLGL